MKIIIILVLLNLSSVLLKAQSIIDFNKFPVDYSNNTPILTSVLLEKLNWESIKKFCDTTKGHYAHIYNNDLKTQYEYVEQGNVSYFNLVSYKGLVLQFDSKIENSSKPTESSYFDKNVWLSYVDDVMPNIPDSLKLELNESQKMLKAYYELLGVDTRDEYGWICEYSTVGLPTARRYAVIVLIHNDRRDLLKKILGYSNVQTQLYAADALIYIDYKDKREIKSYQLILEQQQTELDSLKRIENINELKIKSQESNIKSTKHYIGYIESNLLSKDDWNKIYQLRDSYQEVKICGNSGSYKIYQSNTSELLSDDAIAEIPQKYENIQKSTIYVR